MRGKISLITILALVSIVVIGVLWWKGALPIPSEIGVEKVETPAPDKVSSFKLHEKSSSGLSGTTTLREVNGRIFVDFELRGVEDYIEVIKSDDPVFPARINKGNCDDRSHVVYPLGIVRGEKATKLLRVTFSALKKDAPLNINLRKSEKENEIVIACADINFK